MSDDDYDFYPSDSGGGTVVNSDSGATYTVDSDGNFTYVEGSYNGYSSDDD